MDEHIYKYIIIKYWIIYCFCLFQSTSPRQQPYMSAVRYSVQLCGDVPGAHAGKQAPSQVRPKAEGISPLHSAVLGEKKIKIKSHTTSFTCLCLWL